MNSCVTTWSSIHSGSSTSWRASCPSKIRPLWYVMCNYLLTFSFLTTVLLSSVIVKEDFIRRRMLQRWITGVSIVVTTMCMRMRVRRACCGLRRQAGRFEHEKDKAVVWKRFPVSLHDWLLRLTEEFDLTFPISASVNLVPCLLPQQEPKVILAFFCTLF